MIIKIQRTFLWGGCEDVKKVNWVNRDSVCLPKEVGGLRVKHCGLFNFAFLSKWKWRILNGGSAFW